MEQFNELPRQYIDDGVRDTEYTFDHHYGILHSYEIERFYLRLTQKPVEIIGKDVKVDGLIYAVTAVFYKIKEMVYTSM